MAQTKTTRPPALTKSGEALAALLLSQRVMFDAVDRRLRTELGLSFPLFEALFVLSVAPEGRLRMVDIQRRMLVSKSNVTQLIDKLEGEGLVEREASPIDRRLVYAMLTERGPEAVARGLELFNAVASESFTEFLSKGEIDKITSGLNKVIAGCAPNVPSREARAAGHRAVRSAHGRKS
jgi:DNA-binding MarR family transcriptional regulator